MTPLDPAAGPPSGRAARALAPGGPAADTPRKAAGGKTPAPAQSPQPGQGTTSPQHQDRGRAVAGRTSPGPGVPDAVTPGQGRPPSPAGTERPSTSVPAGSRAFLDAHLAGKMSEAELEEQIRDACNKLGIIRFHVRVSIGTTPGLPDDILIGPGGVLWRECKNQKNKPTPEQAKTGEMLTAIGQDFAIWRPEDWFSGRIKRELLAISRKAAVRVSRQVPVAYAPPETLDGAS